MVRSTPFECFCSVEARKQRGGYAFGSGTYDAISNICMAALHAGVTGREGGDVRVIPGPVQQNYVGTLANGVFSSDLDKGRVGSFTVEPVSGQ
ncbi:MAG: LCCL domain-containing protein [Paracoccaceae bacterium]|nr:LCCL domain-containing protein [Paracoccaceae bacterium]